MELSSMHRGVITNPDRARQLRDYNGLQYGSITPTDIDGFIEYHDKAYIFIELKYKDAPLPFGQRLAYERLIDDLSKTGKPALCIIAVHKVSDPSVDIDVAKTIVGEYRWKGEWLTLNGRITVKSFINEFLSKVIKFP